MKQKKDFSSDLEQDALYCSDCIGNWSDLGPLTKSITKTYKPMFVSWNAQTSTLPYYPSFYLFLYAKRDADNNILEIGFDFAWTTMSAGYNNSSREDAFKDKVEATLNAFFKSIDFSGTTAKGETEVEDFVERLSHDVPLIKEYIETSRKDTVPDHETEYQSAYQ